MHRTLCFNACLRASQIRAELAEKELILLEKETELLEKEQTLVVLKEEVRWEVGWGRGPSIH